VNDAHAAPDARRVRLAAIADGQGVVLGLAIDHRDSLRALAAGTGGALGDADLRDLKRRLIAAVAPMATAVMLDEELGGAALDAGIVPRHVGLIMPLEAQGYEAIGDGRLTRLLDDFGPPDALARGAVACKLLLPFRADDPSAAAQAGVVRRAAEETHGAGLAFVVEPIPYRRAGETERGFTRAWPHLVLASVTALRGLGVDIWKLPFPALQGAPAAAADACANLDAACDGTPWVLLGAGAGIDVFVDQVAVACRAGASGFLAGRGIWGPVVEAAAGGAASVDLESIVSDRVVPAFAACSAA